MSDSEKSPAKRRHIRGGGSVFRKKGWTRPDGSKTKDCKTFSIQYYKDDPATGNRIRVREVGFKTRPEAQRRLTAQLSALDRGGWVETRRKLAVTISDLYDGLKTHILNTATGQRSAAELGWRWAHLKPFFASTPAANVTTDAVRKYIRHRQEEGAANGTINRELTTLRRSFNLGKQSTPPKVLTVPYFPMLRESRPRQGFVEGSDFERLVEKARELWPRELWLRTFLELAFTFGWRRGELLSLCVEQINFPNHTVRLHVGSTKNGDGREVYMTPRVEELLRAVVTGKKPGDYVLTREGRPREPVGQFPGIWEGLCVGAGLGTWTCKLCGAALTARKCECGGRRKYSGLIVHDFRRSAAKAARRAGVPESVIMNMGGWKTASMFRRYAIVSSADQKDAAEAIEAARIQARIENDKPLIAPFRQQTSASGANGKGPNVQ